MSKVGDKIKELRDKCLTKSVKMVPLLALFSASKSANSAEPMNESAGFPIENFIPDHPEDSDVELPNFFDMVSQSIMDKGLNIVSNFDFKNFKWSSENSDDVQEGTISKLLKRCFWAGKGNKAKRTGNFDNHHCLKGVKAILSRAGVEVTSMFEALKSAYQTVTEFRKSPNFVEVQCNYEDLSSLPEGAVVIQDRSKAHPHGHIFIVKAKQNGEKVQECGQSAEWDIPKNNGSFGKNMYAFIPADCKLTQNLVNTMCQEGKCNISASNETEKDKNTNSIVIAKIAKDIKQKG